MEICSDSFGAAHSTGDYQNFVTEEHMREVSRFCVYLLDRVIRENGFSWDDTMVGLLCLDSLHLILWNIAIILLLVASVTPHPYFVWLKEYLEAWF
jgi:hypothetical protein